MPAAARLLALAFAAPALAQAPPTNAEAFGRLAVACAADVATGPVHLAVDAPYLRTALAPVLIARHGPLLADTARARLAVVPEALSVAYARAGRARLRRTVDARFRLVHTAADGRRTAERTCSQSLRDEVPTAARKGLEDVAWPETAGTGPGRSAFARAAATGAAAGAVVVSTLLLFSLRSR